MEHDKLNWYVTFVLCQQIKRIMKMCVSWFELQIDMHVSVIHSHNFVAKKKVFKLFLVNLRQKQIQVIYLVYWRSCWLRIKILYLFRFSIDIGAYAIIIYCYFDLWTTAACCIQLNWLWMVLASISRISVWKHMYNMLHWGTDLNVILISVLKKKFSYFINSIRL